MRAGAAVIVAVTCSLPGLARTQPETTDADAALDVSVHPDIMTVLQLPDTVVRARTLHRDEFQVGFFASRIYVQPRPDTPAGTEALLEVETRTQQRTIRLRVVAHADDAAKMFLVRAQEAEQGTRDAPPAASPEVAPEPAPGAPPGSPSAPSPPRLPDIAHASAPERAEPASAPAGATERPPRFDLSLHAVVALAGATALTVPGYESTDARQPHRAFGVRVAVAHPGAWWAVEASVGGEWLVAPTVHSRGRDRLEISGSLLRADAGLRATLGTTVAPTAYAGIGLQAHQRDIEVFRSGGLEGIRENGDMPFEGVLALGMGLEYRAGDLLLGVELHIRQGVPASYRSVAALLSVGFFLEREDEP